VVPVEVVMRIPHTIKINNHEAWEKWTAEHIGVKNVDYFIVSEKYLIEFDGGGSVEGHETFFEVPDSKKAMLWALKWL
jgi:hypothetical protein